MTNRIRRFLKDQNAAVALEAIIMMPILAWVFVASFIFFDAFRTYNTSLKATYAVADVLSRQTEYIYGSDIDGLGMIFQHITRNTAGSAMRVSEIAWDADAGAEGEYSVDWSYATGGQTRMRDNNIPDIIDQLPIMADGERVFVVETFLPYRPYFDIGIDDLEFTNFTVTRPRFAGQLPFDDGAEPGCTSCNANEPWFGEAPAEDELDESA